MAENHEAVHQMRSDKSSAAGDKDALALGRRKQLDRGEAGEGGVRDGLGVGVVDGLGLIFAIGAGELCVFNLLLLLLARAVRLRGGGHDIVGTKVEGAQDIERDLTVETKALEADSGNDITVLVESTDLRRDLCEQSGARLKV